MIYVGQFSEKQLRTMEHKKAIADKMSETGLKYVKTDIVNKGGKPIAMKVWLMTNEEYCNSNTI